MISQFLKPVNFILLYEAGFDLWACLLYSVLSFLCEWDFFSICSSDVRGASSYCLPSNLSKATWSFKKLPNELFLFSLSFVLRQVLHSSGWPKTSYVAENGPGSMILLPLPQVC